MSIKDMLVYLDSQPSASVRLGAAIEIAHGHRALLTGYYVVEPAHVTSYTMVGEVLSIADLEDEERTRLSERADRMRRSFFQRTGAAHSDTQPAAAHHDAVHVLGFRIRGAGLPIKYSRFRSLR